MKVRYVKSVDERADDELCIDLVEGVFAPSWDVKNGIYYSAGSPKLDKEIYIRTYKMYLMSIWNYTKEDESTNARAKQALQGIKDGEFENLCILTPSSSETPFSVIFMNFLNWVLTT